MIDWADVWSYDSLVAKSSSSLGLPREYQEKERSVNLSGVPGACAALLKGQSAQEKTATLGSQLPSNTGCNYYL